NGKHLLFAARQIGAAAAAPLLQARKRGVDAFQRPALRRRQPGEDDVFLDIETAEDAAILVYELHAGLGDDVALLAGEFGTVEQDRAGARHHYAHQAFQRRAFAGAVAAEQRHDFVALDFERHVEQDVRIPIVGIQPVDLEQAHAAITPPR